MIEKVKTKQACRIIFSLLTLMLVSTICFAQGLTSPCDGGDPDVDCPIDSGIIILVSAGLSIGFFKVLKNDTYELKK